MIIYQVINQINSKRYIGKTCKDLSEPKHRHFMNAKQDRGFYLSNAIRKYGFNNFKFFILDSSAKSNQELIDLEKEYIKARKPEYNMTSGGEGFSGLKRTKEHCLKISKANKGKKILDKHKQQISQANKGRKHTEEAKAKIAESSRTRKLSFLHKEALRKSRLGTKHSEETKKLISIKTKEGISKRKEK